MEFLDLESGEERGKGKLGPTPDSCQRRLWGVSNCEVLQPLGGNLDSLKFLYLQLDIWVSVIGKPEVRRRQPIHREFYSSTAIGYIVEDVRVRHRAVTGKPQNLRRGLMSSSSG